MAICLPVVFQRSCCKITLRSAGVVNNPGYSIAWSLQEKNRSPAPRLETPGVMNWRENCSGRFSRRAWDRVAFR